MLIPTFTLIFRIDDQLLEGCQHESLFFVYLSYQNVPQQDKSVEKLSEPSIV
jgi:hypothetical protein